MAKICISPGCKKEIADDSVFCGYCKTKQDGRKAATSRKANDTGQEVDNVIDTGQIFYADDYEVARQFDPIITPTKEKVSFENLFSTFQEMVKSKNYPFAVENKEQRWRTEGGKGKQRIVIQPRHDPKWQKIIFPVAVEQLGNDTTIKLSVFRKNEMAEFYYLTHDSVGIIPAYASAAIDYKINWLDGKKYGPIIDQAISNFAVKVEEILCRLKPAEIDQKSDISDQLKCFIRDFLNDNPGYKKYCQEQKEKHIKLQNFPKEAQQQRQPLLNEIQQIEKVVSDISSKMQRINNEIKAAQENFTSFEGMKTIVIICAILVFIFTVSSLGFTAVLIAGGIYGAWAFIKSMKKGTLDNLRKGDLKRVQEELRNINSQLSQKKSELQKVDNAIATNEGNIKNSISTNKSNIISKIVAAKNGTFQVAEQNERKWREPSFVDEELEQLISVVKNLFNQITGKVTAKKEVKDVKLQSTMGLGGMGFEE
jgi:uncharacterized protein YlxW (UPF0749 family)